MMACSSASSAVDLLSSSGQHRPPIPQAHRLGRFVSRLRLRLRGRQRLGEGLVFDRIKALDHRVGGEAIARTLALGIVACEPQPTDNGERLTIIRLAALWKDIGHERR
jgi:hypothetical protein